MQCTCFVLPLISPLSIKCIPTFGLSTFLSATAKQEKCGKSSDSIDRIGKNNSHVNAAANDDDNDTE